MKLSVANAPHLERDRARDGRGADTPTAPPRRLRSALVKLPPGHPGAAAGSEGDGLDLDVCPMPVGDGGAW